MKLMGILIFALGVISMPRAFAATQCGNTDTERGAEKVVEMTPADPCANIKGEQEKKDCYSCQTSEGDPAKKKNCSAKGYL